MKKWEYKYLPAREELVPQMNALGEKGWRATLTALSDGNGMFFVLMEREITDSPSSATPVGTSAEQSPPAADPYEGKSHDPTDVA